MERVPQSRQVLSPKLEDHLGTRIGLNFQRIDSDIADTTMQYFANENVPIHDSFIMHKRY
jgi:hypothetical protein